MLTLKFQAVFVKVNMMNAWDSAVRLYQSAFNFEVIVALAHICDL